MKIEKAVIGDRDGRPTPFVRVGGRWYCIETKPSLIAAGVAALQPLREDLEDDWDAASEHRVTLPADPDNGRPGALILEHFTADSEVVALAGKFARLAAEGIAAPGVL